MQAPNQLEVFTTECIMHVTIFIFQRSFAKKKKRRIFRIRFGVLSCSYIALRQVLINEGRRNVKKLNAVSGSVLFTKTHSSLLFNAAML